MQRREFISGILATLGGTAMAESVRSNVAARGISLSGGGSDAEAMLQNWLDFFANGYAMTDFEDDSVVELGVNLFPNEGGHSPLSVAFNALERITGRNIFYGSRIVNLFCPKLTEIYGTQHFQNSSYLETVDFPSLSVISDFNWWLYNCPRLKTINLGNVTELPNTQNTSFGPQDTALEDVYLLTMQTATLLSYTHMLTSATTGSYTPHQIVFHCADGNVAWSDAEGKWVKVAA